MPTVSTEIPEAGAIIFRFTDIDAIEADLKLTMWREIDVAYDGDLIDYIPFKKGQADPNRHYTTGFPTGADDPRLKLYRPNVEFVINSRVITTNPEYSKKIEKYFGQALIDGISFSIYDTNIDADVISFSAPQKPDAKVVFADNPYDRLFSRYIKPQREMSVYCAWYIRKVETTKWKLRTVQELMNAIDGGDVRWDHPKKDNPYLTLLAGGNKETNRETIWNLKFSNIAMTGLGKTPARPVTNKDDPSSYYMPFFNNNIDPLCAATKRGFPPISALPYSSTPIAGSKVGIDVIPIVDDWSYLDTASGTRRGVWRRHISLGEWLKNGFDFAFGVDKYNFVCEDSLMSFIGAKLMTPNAPPMGTGYTSVLGGYPFSTPAGDIAPPNNEKNFVNAHWDIPLEKMMLIPQCLFGLYDEILPPSADGIPLLQKHWGNQHSSLWDVILEVCYSLGWVPSVQTVDGAKPILIRFLSRRTLQGNKFTTIVPDSASPQQFPESEMGIEVTRQETFKNDVQDDGDYDDWFAYHTDSKVSYGDKLRVRFANPYTFPVKAQKPAQMTMSMTLGADMNGGVLAGFAFAASIHWYSTGMPHVAAAHQREAEATERFPMTTPLIYCKNSGIYPACYTDQNVIDYATALGRPASGYAFRPVLLMDDALLPLADGSFGREWVVWRQGLAELYASLYVRAQIKYTETFPTCTEFTNVETGETDFDQKDIYFLHDIFDDEFFVWSFKENWEEIKTTLEQFQTKALPRSVLPEDFGGSVTDVPDEPPVITPNADPAEPICGHGLNMIFSVAFLGQLCSIGMTIDGVAVAAIAGQSFGGTTPIFVTIDPCTMAIGIHIICLTVVPCDIRIAPVTQCWNYIVNHFCC